MDNEKREAQVTAQVQSLEKSVEALINLAVELRDRLAPILSPVGKNEDESGKVGEEIAPLAHSLRAIDLTLLDGRKILQDVIHRLEI